MQSTAKEKKAKPAQSSPPYDVGDTVWVAFYRPHPMPHPSSPLGIDQGAWDVLYGTVISVGGKLVCVEVSPNTPPQYGGVFEANQGSNLRMADPARVFTNKQDAEAYAKAQK